MIDRQFSWIYVRSSEKYELCFGLATNTLNVRNINGGCSEGLDAFRFFFKRFFVNKFESERI